MEDEIMRGWIVLFALCLCFPRELLPCSSAVATGGGSVLIANNKDLRPADQTAQLHVVPGREERYGKIFWGEKNVWVQCGVNEAGLFIDRVVAPAIEDYALMGEAPAFPIASLILDQCATVDEAVALFRRYRVSQLNGVHFLIADKSGASVIVEWDGHDLAVLPKSGDLQIMTNFRLTRPESGDHPCYRYNAMLRLLRGKEHDADLLRQALDVTHLEDMTYYSNIVDLTAGTITVFGCHDFGCSRTFTLSEELTSGEHSYTMEQLFPPRRVTMDRLERRNGLVYAVGEEKPFSGICFLEHENGKLLKEGRVKNGLCAGCWKYYDPDGICTREDKYRRVLLFYDSGLPRAEGMVKNNRLIGPWVWRNEDGSIALEGEAMDGILYRKGEQHPFSGKLVTTFRNGDPSSERRFARGLLDGEALDWYENGHLRSEGQFESGIHAGQWVLYKRDGTLDHVMLYEDGGSSP
jgi:antitoxin component YwqK of YwqJK toxin-antitoxin module